MVASVGGQPTEGSRLRQVIIRTRRSARSVQFPIDWQCTDSDRQVEELT
jgi:hypothetical protein